MVVQIISSEDTGNLLKKNYYFIYITIFEPCTRKKKMAED